MLSFPSPSSASRLVGVRPPSTPCSSGRLHALGSVVAAAFVAPFTAAVTSLQYLDQRMRKEAYDVELMAQAGITAS